MFKEREVIWWKHLLGRVLHDYQDGTHVKISIIDPNRGWDYQLIVDQRELTKYQF